MRELFYRRETAGGYKVVAREASLSAKEEAFCAQKALPVSAGEVPLLTYKQCCTGTGALMVSCGYIDPHGSRGSGLAHALMTQDDAEREALLDAYPAASAYFEDIRARYTAGDAPLALEEKALRVPLAQYLGNGGGGPAEAAALLRETFGDEALLAKVFAALLDCASPNPRMLAVVLEDDSIEALADHGRRVAEALFCCLPGTVATRLGYLSPALGLSDAAFALRFVRDPAVAKSSMVYVAQPSQGRLTPPSNQKPEPGEYPLALAARVFDGSPEALAWVRDMRRRLTDWTVFASKDIGRDVALRYAFYTRPDALDPREKRLLLDWRHDMTVLAVRDGAAVLEGSALWADVDAWVKENLAPELWEKRNEWRRGAPLYDPAVARTLLEDARSLHALGRDEARYFGALFERRLNDGTLCADADWPRVSGELLGSFCDQVGRFAATGLDGGSLYWPSIEAWVRDQWAEGALIKNGRVNEAVRRLVALDPGRLDGYLDPYVNHLGGRKVPLCGSDTSDFHEMAVKRLLARDRQGFGAVMARDLGAADPFASEEGMRVYSWYRARIGGDDDLNRRLREQGEKHLKAALSAKGLKDVPTLLDELNGNTRDGMLVAAMRLGMHREAAADVEDCLVGLLKEKGFFDWYPQDMDTTRRIADLLDRAHAYDRRRWSQRLATLEQVRGLELPALTKTHFDSYRGICDHDMDGHDREKARQLLWDKTREYVRGAKQPEDGALMWALAMKSYENGAVCPGDICRDAEALGLSGGAMKRSAKKLADESAAEGLGYLGRVTLDCLKRGADGYGDDRCPYPGDGTPAAQGAKGMGGGAFAGLPMAVPVAGTLLFGGGLATGVVSLLRMIGLM